MTAERSHLEDRRDARLWALVAVTAGTTDEATAVLDVAAQLAEEVAPRGGNGHVTATAVYLDAAVDLAKAGIPITAIPAYLMVVGRLSDEVDVSEASQAVAAVTAAMGAAATPDVVLLAVRGTLAATR